MSGAAETLDVLAIGAHPDDVELSAGATVASCVDRGYRVGIVHLTRGELGTRGTAEERAAEARAAAHALGSSDPIYLDCGDGGLRTGRDQEDALIDVLRRYRPSLVLAPPPSDRHPDHGRAHRLVVDSCFYAGLARRGRGEPHRPRLVLSYMQHHAFEPRLVVDVTAAWRKKMAALACYRSQFHNAESGDRSEPMTKVASAEFSASVIGRAQHFGQMIGAAFGEPFWSPTPLAVADPLQILPPGLP